MDAQTGGSLTDVGGCLGATLDERVYVVVWPAGTTVDGDAISVDDTRLTLQHSFAGSGGFMSEQDRPDGLPSAPPACLEAADSDEVMWVQSVETWSSLMVG